LGLKFTPNIYKRPHVLCICEFLFIYRVFFFKFTRNFSDVFEDLRLMKSPVHEYSWHRNELWANILFHNTLVSICTILLMIKKLSILPHNVFLCFVLFPDQHRLLRWSASVNK
jgi:hypothetical protein